MWVWLTNIFYFQAHLEQVDINDQLTYAFCTKNDGYNKIGSQGECIIQNQQANLKNVTEIKK